MSTSRKEIEITADTGVIFSRLCEHLSSNRQHEAQVFVEQFFRRVGDEELTARSINDWVGLARGILDFLRLRQPNSPKIQVYNPALQEHGWECAHTVIQIVTDDMPFLVDSVGMAIATTGALVHTVIHPVLNIERDPGGHALHLDEEGSAKGRHESVMHFEIDRAMEPEELLQLKENILAALSDVRASVEDWRPMREKMLAIAEELSTRQTPVMAEGIAEAQEFLRWVADDHFTFLGYREYEVINVDNEEVLKAIPGSGLGILREHGTVAARPLKALTARSLPQSGSTDALILTKANARASVHRQGYMDYIGILKFDVNGIPVAEQRFLGLYTSGAYTRRPQDVPLVRHKVNAVMTRSQIRRDSHSGKALRHILETLPRDELFQCTEDELFSLSFGILNLQERIRTRLFVRRDRYGRFFSCLIFIPRDRFNNDVRERIEALLRQAFHGTRVDSNILVGDSALARLHLVIRPEAGDQSIIDLPELEVNINKIVRNWHDELREILVHKHGEDVGLKLANRYGKTLPMGYIEDVTPEIAATDVETAASLKSSEDIRLSLYRIPKQPEGLRFKLFRFESPIPLSEALPMLESLGLKILSEHPYEMEVGGTRIVIQDFEVQSAIRIDVDEQHEAFQTAFEHIWRGQAENDGFNRLILSAQTSWRQVAVLRSYCKYLLQTGVPFSQSYMEETLSRYPLIAGLLLELFEAKFDPARENLSIDVREFQQDKLNKKVGYLLHSQLINIESGVVENLYRMRQSSRSEQLSIITGLIHRLLEKVAILDEDRILRSYLSIINATLRTNFYQKYEGKPKDYISLKFDPAKIPDLPKPRPYREIFVCSPRVEGVHLRFGPVARGGLRWSDRREDFRTEVLGLVKAQMVKNTVIVPVGAKGGFFVKRSPVSGDRDAVLAEGVACYRMFISGLLDITDNLRDGKVIYPVDVMRHDGDDPYLVVAADKGTATFSDIANALSAEYGFWLGDAFASGGSVGYDHKGMGITAKGGWESVKRHFRTLSRDCQSEDFTCIGIGDMSGDVFGNGMLLSRHIQLVAAFDHRHIFLDPNPDANISFLERERLFKLPRSSWADYDTKFISPGGGVFSRSAKAIPLSPQVKTALGIGVGGVDSLSPNELMRAILLAPVDLLWNGGIGTYVKATSETNADVGDRANNPIRVNGKELRCKVIGEGGNLGMTQRGRIEAAFSGVLLNTDFIDNSAGVDTSDHEVNIKILLNDAVHRGELSVTDRNKLLADMTEEVERLVLLDNYRQNQAISLMERMSVARLGAKEHFIRVLESEALLDRQLEFLPSDEEFRERKARGLGLTRPELSILLSYSKIVTFQKLLNSDVPEDPHLSKELQRYFPEPLRVRYAEHMGRHRLKREIIATAVTNSMINRMGSTFMLRMQEDTGQSPASVAKAYTIAREVLDARSLWTDIEALDGKVNSNAQIDALLSIWSLLRTMTRWILLHQSSGFSDIAQVVQLYQPGMNELRNVLCSVITANAQVLFEQQQQRWIEQDFPASLATQLASLFALDSALDIVFVAKEKKLQVSYVAKGYYQLGEALHLEWLMDKIENLSVASRWHAQARSSLRDELYSQHRTLTARILGKNKESEDASQLVNDWLACDEPTLNFTLSMLAEIRTQVTVDYPIVSVAVRRLTQLVQTGERKLPEEKSV